MICNWISQQNKTSSLHNFGVPLVVRHHHHYTLSSCIYWISIGTLILFLFLYVCLYRLLSKYRQRPIDRHWIDLLCLNNIVVVLLFFFISSYKPETVFLLRIYKRRTVVASEMYNVYLSHAASHSKYPQWKLNMKKPKFGNRREMFVERFKLSFVISWLLSRCARKLK